MNRAGEFRVDSHEGILAQQGNGGKPLDWLPCRNLLRRLDTRFEYEDWRGGSGRYR